MVSDLHEEATLRRKALKKEIKMTFGQCSKMLLILGILTQVIGVAIALGIKYRAQIMHLSMNINNKTGLAFGIQMDLYNFLIGYLPCILGESIAIIIGLKLTKINMKKDMFCKVETKPGFVLYACLACIGTGMVSSLIYLIYSSILGAGGLEIPQPDFNMPEGNTLMLYVFLAYVCVIGPILEEIIFRGIILKSMKKFGAFTAVITTSILFAMFHLNLVQFAQPILIGMILGFVTIKSGSIIPAIIIHMFNNTIVFSMSQILNEQNFVTASISFAYIFGGVIMLIMFIKKYGLEFMEMLNENTVLLKVWQKVRAAFSSKCFLAYLLFYMAMVGTSIFYFNLTK